VNSISSEYVEWVKQGRFVYKFAQVEEAYLVIEMSVQSLPEWMEDTLECPVCLKTIVDPPVYLCENTHPLCDICHDELKQRKEPCPVCRGKLTDKRSWSIEKILDKLQKAACKYEKCSYKKADKARVEGHEEDCEHRLLCCYHCKEYIPLSNMSEHIVGRHKKPSGGWVLHANLSTSWEIPEVADGIAATVSNITIDGKTISFHCNYLLGNPRYLLIWCSHNGSKSDKRTYQFSFSLYDGKAKDKGKNEVVMTYKGFCHPMDVPLESIKDDMTGAVVPRQFIRDNVCSENKTHFAISFSRTPSDD